MRMHPQGVTSVASKESALRAAGWPFSSVPWCDVPSHVDEVAGGVSVITMCDNVAYMADTCALRADSSTHANSPSPPSSKRKCARLHSSLCSL